MNDINTYLKHSIEEFDTNLTIEEKKQLQFEGKVAYILKKINSNKYKQAKFPEVLIQKIQGIVTTAVAESKPIHFSIPFGGFKKWQYPHYPAIGWEEIFNIIQLRNFAIEIAKGYEPGVIIQYVSDEVFISRMNNMSQEDLDHYNSSFNLAVAYIQQFTPPNVMLRFTKIRDELSQQEVLKRFDEGIIGLKQKWAELPIEERKKRLEKTARNYKLDKKKYTKNELERLYLESTLVHDAFIFTEWERGTLWAFRGDMIPIGFRYTGTWGINLKSSPTSAVQFWVGFGLLEEKDGSFAQKILTYNQYLEVAKKTIFKEQTVIPAILLEKIPVLVN